MIILMWDPISKHNESTYIDMVLHYTCYFSWVQGLMMD